MSDSWVVQNLQNALNTWNEKLTEVWQLVSQSPESFKGGAIWSVVQNIHGGLQAVGLALLVLFFVTGVMKTCGSLAETKSPEVAVKLFIRFALAKAAVTYGMELMMALFNIVQVGLSFSSHDPSQRSNGFLTLAGGVVITFTKEILNMITG